jgi:hypothetical protein
VIPGASGVPRHCGVRADGLRITPGAQPAASTSAAASGAAQNAQTVRAQLQFTAETVDGQDFIGMNSCSMARVVRT